MVRIINPAEVTALQECLSHQDRQQCLDQTEVMGK
jgi:hypothetical protein